LTKSVFAFSVFLITVPLVYCSQKKRQNR